MFLTKLSHLVLLCFFLKIHIVGATLVDVPKDDFEKWFQLENLRRNQSGEIIDSSIGDIKLFKSQKNMFSRCRALQIERALKHEGVVLKEGEKLDEFQISKIGNAVLEPHPEWPFYDLMEIVSPLKLLKKLHHCPKLSYGFYEKVTIDDCYIGPSNNHEYIGVPLVFENVDKKKKIVKLVSYWKTEHYNFEIDEN